MLSFLPHGGTKDCEIRGALMDRFVRLFGAARIEILLADREFIGGNWLQHLNKNSIPFAIRLKTNMYLHRKTGGWCSWEPYCATLADHGSGLAGGYAS